MSAIHQLSQSSAHLLSSSNIITSIFSVVKELVENAVDAGATSVEVKLENYGLGKIEVRDNGIGIKQCDIPFVAKSHFTSKISSFDDLEQLTTYGFRGEAMGAICGVSQLSITTQTSSDDLSTTYVFDKQGAILSKKPSPSPAGTAVTVVNLFHNIPVRKKLYRREKLKRDELKKIENLLCAFALAQVGTRFALYHNRSLIWSKTGTSDLKVAVIQVFGSLNFSHLEYRTKDYKEKMSIEAYLPQKCVPVSQVSRNARDRTIIIINKRPVRVRAIEKLLQSIYCRSDNGDLFKNLYPICLLLITIPSSAVDVNVDPNKTLILLHNFEEILSLLCEFLHSLPVDVVLSESIKFLRGEHNYQKTLYELENSVGELPPDIIASLPSPNSNYSNVASSDSNSPCHKTMSNCTSPTRSSVTEAPVNSSKNRFLETRSSELPSTQRNTSLRTVNPTASLNEPRSVEPSTTHPLTDFDFDFEEDFFDRNKNDGQLIKEPVHKKGENGNASDLVNVNSDNDANFSNSLSSDLSKHASSFCSPDENPTAPATSQPKADCNWAQGRLPFAKGDQLQPVSVLIPSPKKKRCQVESTTPSSTKKRQKGIVVESVRNAVSDCAPKTAFDIFCRDKRLETVAEHPSFSNKDIAEHLFEQWKCYPSEKREFYSKLLAEKSKKPQNKVSSSQCNPKSSRLDKISSSPKHVCERTLQFSFEELRSLKKDPTNVFSESVEDSFVPINPLSSGVWICCKDRRLFLLNTYRMQEMLLFNRLLDTYQLKADLLTTPIILTPESLGDSESYETLLLICMKENSSAEILNASFTYNGFKIKFSKGECAAQLVGMASAIPAYGLQDLREVLLTVKNKGLSVPLSECRPFKVSQYIQGEAVRIARQSLGVQRKDDLLDLLSQSQRCLKDCSSCFHNRPFHHELFNLKDAAQE